MLMKRITKKRIKIAAMLAASAFLLISFISGAVTMQLSSLVIPENFKPVGVGGLSFKVYNSDNVEVGTASTGGSGTGGSASWDGDTQGLYPRIHVQYSQTYRSDQYGNPTNDTSISTARRYIYNGTVYFEHDFYQTVDILVRTYVKPPVRKAVNIPLSPMVHTEATNSIANPAGTRVFLGDVDYYHAGYDETLNVEGRLVVVQDVGAWTAPIRSPSCYITAALEQCYFPNVNNVPSLGVDTVEQSIVKILNTYSNQYVKVVPTITLSTRSTESGFNGYTYYFNTTLPDGTAATMMVDTTGISTGILEGIDNCDGSMQGLVPNSFPANYKFPGGTDDPAQYMDTRSIAANDAKTMLSQRQSVSGDTYATGYVEFMGFDPVPIAEGGQGIPLGISFTQPSHYFPDLANPSNNYDMASTMDVHASFGMKPRTTIVRANTRVGWSGYYWSGYWWAPISPTAFAGPEETTIHYPVYCNLENTYSLSKMTFLTAFVTKDDISAVRMSDGKPIDISRISDNYLTSIMKNPTADDVSFSYKVPTPPDLWGQISAWFSSLFSTFGPMLSIVIVIVAIVLVMWLVGKLGGGLKSFVGLFKKSK